MLFMLILASASPRRRELLTQINCNFVCRVADCTEISPAQEKILQSSSNKTLS